MTSGRDWCDPHRPSFLEADPEVAPAAGQSETVEGRPPTGVEYRLVPTFQDDRVSDMISAS